MGMRIKLQEWLLRTATGRYVDPTTGTATLLEGMTFHAANAYCKTLHANAHLLVINDQAEHEFIFSWMPGIEPVEMWIGLFYNATAMAFQWVNGDPLLYTAWEPFYGEPLIRNGGAALMFMSEVFTPQFTQMFGYGFEVSHFWNTEAIDEPFPFICEYNLPTTNTPTTTAAPTTNTTVDTNSTTAASGPATMAPQVLFQRHPQPIRLSDYLGFGGLRERKIDESRQGGNRNRLAPQAYKKLGNYMGSRSRYYGYGYPVMP
ncbi:30 kDa spicule matrix protein-like [Diadema setosum]|uniref:30 kDa spicule matrix protein-like n=1 Tax=Diadema setosum TaxID=31175 RepID=UPI003B3B39E1